jgi:hypothetical protein
MPERRAVAPAGGLQADAPGLITGRVSDMRRDRVLFAVDITVSNRVVRTHGVVGAARSRRWPGQTAGPQPASAA